MTYVQATTHTDTGKLVWDSNGYYMFGSDSWKDISVTARMIYQNGTIGLIPRFDSEITYVAFTIGVNGATSTMDGLSMPGDITSTASLFAQISSNQIHLEEKRLTTNLVVGQEYTIKIDIKKTNYKVYLDGTLIFNVEYNGLNNGSVALYGTKDTQAVSAEVQSEFPDGWISNVDTINSAIVDIERLDNGDKYIFMKNPGTTDLYVEQTVAVTAGAHTLSSRMKGALNLEVKEMDGAAPKTTQTLLNTVTEWTDIDRSYDISADCTQVKIRFYTNIVGETAINNIQLEPLKHKTSYIHNDSLTNPKVRDSSFITYPAKDNISATMGSISMWVKPLVTYNTALGALPVLIEYGSTDKIKLSADGINIKFTYGSKELSTPLVLQKDTWYHIVASWSDSLIRLTVNGVTVEENGMYTFNGSSDIIRPGHSEDGIVFNGIIDDLIIFSKVIDTDYITEIKDAVKPVASHDDMVLRATFEYAIGNFNKSIIEMSPAPLYGSPVIAKKQDGTPMQKVSFFDRISGEFKTYNSERIIYDGKSDYLRVGYKDVDTTSFRIMVRDWTGALVGDPYQVSGNKILISLTDKDKKDLRGKPLYVTYQPENPYAVDYNIGQPDSFRVTLGKHDGQAVTVQYEGNKVGEEKLATMVELNPLLNPNHKGFIYIVKQPNEISTFRAKSSPSDLPADGISEAVVTIEPLDTDGNFISSAKLEVTAKYGLIVPNFDEGSVRLRETAGRYLYKYRAPLMTYSDKKLVEMTDSINVVDRVTGLGVQIPVALTLMDNYYTGNMEKPHETKTWEVIGAYLLGKVTDNISKKVTELPTGLGAVLDFNGDGMIDIKEIIWLNQYKFTQDLYNKYIAVLDWYKANG